LSSCRLVRSEREAPPAGVHDGSPQQEPRRRIPRRTPRTRTFIDKLESIQIKDGKVILRAKPKAERSSSSPNEPGKAASPPDSLPAPKATDEAAPPSQEKAKDAPAEKEPPKEAPRPPRSQRRARSREVRACSSSPKASEGTEARIGPVSQPGSSKGMGLQREAKGSRRSSVVMNYSRNRRAPH